MNKEQELWMNILLAGDYKPKSALFTTLDEVEIYEGDSWYYVVEGKWEPKQTSTLTYRGNSSPTRIYRFKNPGVAKDFCILMKAKDALKRNPSIIKYINI